MLWCLYLVSFCAERPSTQLGKAFSGRRRILPPVVVVLRLASSRRTSSSKRSRFNNLTGAYIPALQGQVLRPPTDKRIPAWLFLVFVPILYPPRGMLGTLYFMQLLMNLRSWPANDIDAWLPDPWKKAHAARCEALEISPLDS